MLPSQHPGHLDPISSACRQVSGKPIKFVGVGEKLEALEPFFPERMASRILGMGDVLSLFEKAESVIKVGQGGRAGQQGGRWARVRGRSAMH